MDELDLRPAPAADPSTNYQGNYQRHMLTTGLTMEYRGDWATVHYGGQLAVPQGPDAHGH